MVMVIGYGNSLRGDDGAGPQVVQQLQRHPLPGVHTRIEHQLLPELAATIAPCDRVIFVDVHGDPLPALVIWEELAPASHWDHSHHLDPSQLLGLCQWLYGTAPQAWGLWLQGEAFPYGETYSPTIQRAIPQALAQLRTRLTQWGGDHA